MSTKSHHRSLTTISEIRFNIIFKKGGTFVLSSYATTCFYLLTLLHVLIFLRYYMFLSSYATTCSYLPTLLHVLIFLRCYMFLSSYAATCSTNFIFPNLSTRTIFRQITNYTIFFLEKLMVSQPVKKFPTFYGIRSLITGITTACQPSLS